MSRSVPLDPQTLLSAYAQGAFPMAGPDGCIAWYTADPRGVLPLEAFHVPQTLRVLVRKGPELGGFEVRINHDFEAAMRGCMEARAGETWITNELIDAYSALHRLGYAHSVECYRNNELAGGLYGVSLGAAFFGESMFHRQPDASKVALVHLVHRLNDRDFELLDTQAVTTPLRRFGCIEIPAVQYMPKLKSAISKTRKFD